MSRTVKIVSFPPISAIRRLAATLEEGGWLPEVVEVVSDAQALGAIDDAITAGARAVLVSGAADLVEARTRKALLECEKLDIQLAILRDEYIRKVEVRESGIRIGAIFSAKLAALVNDASGALAGLGEAEHRKKLNERTQGILAEIREELEKV